MPKVKKTRFRIQYKTFGLTYSRCPLERDVLVRKLEELLPIEEYFCVRETHKDPGTCPYHLHVWFKTVNKPNIKNPRYFDIDGYHPNIGKKNRAWIWNYLKKQDTDPFTNIAEGYVGLAQSGQLDNALLQFANLHPKEYVIHYPRVRENLRQMTMKKREEKYYTFGSYDIMPADWDMEQQSLHLQGEPGTGKTEFVKSWLNHHGYTYLRVTHLDGLKKYRGEDFIMFDDVSFMHLPRETQIHLCEVKNSADIHCRHTVAHIPAGTKKIFLSNYGIFTNDPAINRRVRFWAPSIRFY